MCPTSTDGLCSVIVKVRTPSPISARVTAFISASVLVSGDSMILFSAFARLRIPVALRRRGTPFSAARCSVRPARLANPAKPMVHGTSSRRRSAPNMNGRASNASKLGPDDGR